MTPQDIRERALEKAVFGGYDMAAVDKLREEAAVELAACQKEIAVLRGKMKVLVDKVEEYRATENDMRLTLAAARKIAQKIQDDAQAHADQVIADADAYAERVIGGLQSAKAEEEERLLIAKSSSARFIQDARALCLSQVNYLDTLSTAEHPGIAAQEAPAVAATVNPSAVPAAPEPAQVEAAEAEAPAPQPEVQETIRSIDDSVAQVAEEAPEIDITPVIENNSPAIADAADDATQLYNFLHNS